MEPDGIVLNEYVVAGRYPGDIIFEDIGPAEAREALDFVGDPVAICAHSDLTQVLAGAVIDRLTWTL